jgi:hypothetical protein
MMFRPEKDEAKIPAASAAAGQTQPKKKGRKPKPPVSSSSLCLPAYLYLTSTVFHSFLFLKAPKNNHE